MKIWTPQEMIPAAAVTYAGGNTDDQPILFTTQFGHQGEYSLKTQSGGRPNTGSFKLEWVIRSVSVVLDRSNWGVSTANISLTINLPDSTDEIISLPDLTDIRGGNYGPLTVEDEIRIYAGYVKDTFTPITGAMLDEAPIDYEDIEGGVTKQDPKKPLAPIFWGFIDKIDLEADARGIQILISCRDRGRVFADTKVIGIPSVRDTQAAGLTLDGDGIQINGDRPTMMIALANAAVGYKPSGNVNEPGGECSCWKEIVPGYIVRGFSFAGDNRIIGAEIRTNPAKWLLSASNRIMNTNANPRFNIWAERGPLTKNNAAVQPQVINKSPMEVFQFFAQTENRTMDFFTSHVNGDFIFGPRVVDFSGFFDPLRSHRTYFFKTYPKEVGLPTPNQMILKMKTGTTTLFSYNKYLVTGSKENGNSVNVLDSLRVSVFKLPWELEGRNPSPPCKTVVIPDATLSSYQATLGSEELGAVYVAQVAARNLSRQSNTMQLTLLGDPTFYPGEGIQIYNSVIHDKQTFVLLDSEADEEAYRNFEKKMRDRVEDLESEAETDLDRRAIASGCSGSTSSRLVNEFLQDKTAKGSTSSELDRLVLPRYRIYTVQHTITAQGQRGFTTTIAGSTGY